MLFEHTVPIAAGYFQCDISRDLAQRNVETQASLLYMTSGEGVWTVGNWKFPVRRGDMFGIPRGMRASAELNDTRPLGYFYTFFELPSSAAALSLEWPWALGIEPKYCAAGTCASGPFRPEIAALYRALQYELAQRKPTSLLAAKAHLSLLGVNYSRMLALSAARTHPMLPLESERPQRVIKAQGPLPEAVARVVDFVSSRLDEELSLPQLAGIAHCSERHLVGLFREATGLSPIAFVRDRRVREAKRLLMEGLTVKEVSTRLNFADSHHFSRVFRQLTGISPTEFVAGKPVLLQRQSGEFAMAAR